MAAKKKTSDTKKSGDQPAGAEAGPGAASPFPIVGIGASAGGLEALKAFFPKVEKTSGMAYVVVVHMAPNQPSMMAELLQGVTPIQVAAAEDGRAIEPNRAYIIPPDKEISVFKGKIQLMDAAAAGPALPIDLFLRSLAQDRERYAAAVILSGMGTDGTLGAKEIKAREGVVLAQSEESASHDSMPRSVINAGLADLILAPEEMPPKLIQYFSHSKTAMTGHDADVPEDRQKRLNKIFAVLRARTGHDFSAYKANTVLRRIGRRMSLNQIDGHETYVRFLRENPEEADALLREMLIGVTRFFRDPESFEVLKNKALPDMLSGMPDDAPFRAWVPGCSTGEEVYSLAMTLHETMAQTSSRRSLQLFGTDIDNRAVEKAREGLYPASIAADVDAGRLKRFFTREGGFFRIRKDIRDSVVFSVQNILKDPPFSRLNLLCCRNVLIYLDAGAQKKLLPLFHYTLNPGGALVLGSSETIGGFSNLFEPLGGKEKIFRRREVPQSLRHAVDFPIGPQAAAPGKDDPAAGMIKNADIAQSARKAILDAFAPTAVLVDARGDILHVQGRTGKYLETPGGPPTHNILDLAREGLRIELSSALRAAGKSDERIIRGNVAVKTNGEVQHIRLHVRRLHEPKALAGRFLVAFEDVAAPPPPDADAGNRSGRENARIAELERELQVNRESHQTTVEELESANEELKSTNEELQSSNEELQSSNEELESSKEELQSLNEELQTVNAELENKVSELSAAHDDMRNLLNNTEIATIFVDNDLCVRRFTPEAVGIVNLIPTDIGRFIGHVVNNLDYDGLMDDLADVLKTLAPREAEVRTVAGDWHKMRILPYRTTDNRIDGAVLTFSPINEQKKTQGELKDAVRGMETAWTLVRAVFDMNREPMAVLDSDDRIVIANRGFTGLVNASQETIAGADFFSLQQHITKREDLKTALNAALEKGTEFKTPTIGMTGPEGKRTFVIHGRIIRKDDDFPYRILLRFENAA